MLTRRQRTAVHAALMLSGVLFALALGEVYLRVTGFEYQPFPVVQFGWPDPKAIVQVYRSDPDLLWVTTNYDEQLEAARRRRPAVVFMGDSCTQFGTYPSKALALLAHERPSLSYGIKVGVGGWSVVQGSWQLMRDVLPMRPRIVTIYYGWNDHWIALGPPDAEIRRDAALTWLADHVRLMQLLAKVRTGFVGPEAARPNRVDLDTYQATLERMVRQIHGIGAQAVLITAGENHTPGAEPEYLARRHLRHLSDLIPVHQSYVEATRRAARETGAVLCDAAARFAAASPAERNRLFRHDGIHLSYAGDAMLARMLASSIEQADEARGVLSQ